MSIDRTSALKPVSAVQPRETNDATPQKRVWKTVNVQQHQRHPERCSGKTDAAGQQRYQYGTRGSAETAIRNGELKMDTSKIADALIQEAQSFLQ